MEVNLTKKVVVDGRKLYCPVVIQRNGRVRADYVIVGTKDKSQREEHHPEGAYYLDWNENGKRIRKSVGKDPAIAAAKRRLQESILDGKRAGMKDVPALPSDRKRPLLLSESIALYLENIQLNKKSKTHSAYTTALDYFQESCKKQTVAEIERADLLKFAGFLRDEKEQAPRSCWNKFANVMSFLKSQGVRGLMQKNDWPKFTEEEPEIYEQEELTNLFNACDAEELLWFEFFLMTGEREQEVMYTYWRDVNLNAAIVKVSHKPDRGWTPKAYKEREIPIPARLVESLKAYREKSDRTCNLLFPTSGCNPKLDFLDCLKACAERAKLDKGQFWLHKFRATYATRCLWAGVDFRTVQLWLGHSDIESTMRYLKPSRSQAVHEKVNTIFA